jgi:hypothetical protein
MDSQLVGLLVVLFISPLIVLAIILGWVVYGSSKALDGFSGFCSG